MIDSPDDSEAQRRHRFALPAWHSGPPCSRADGSVRHSRRGRRRPAGARPAAPPTRRLSAGGAGGQASLLRQDALRLGQMSCATCHDPDHAYGPPNDLAVQLGGPQGFSPACAPSLACATKSSRPATPISSTTPTASAARPRRRVRLGRPRQLARRAGQAAAALAVRNGQRQPRRRGRAARASPYAPAFAQAFGAAALADVECLRQRASGAAVVPNGRPQLPPLHQQVRSYLYKKRRRADAGRGARAGLQAPSSATARAATFPAPLGRRRAGSSPTTPTKRSASRATRDPRQPRPQIHRSRPVRPAPRRSRQGPRVLRPVQDADPAQRRHAAGVLPQRRDALARAGGSLLQHARHHAGALVPDGRRPPQGEARPRLSRATGSSPPSTWAASSRSTTISRERSEEHRQADAARRPRGRLEAAHDRSSRSPTCSASWRR